MPTSNQALEMTNLGIKPLETYTSRVSIKLLILTKISQRANYNTLQLHRDRDLIRAPGLEAIYGGLPFQWRIDSACLSFEKSDGIDIMSRAVFIVAFIIWNGRKVF